MEKEFRGDGKTKMKA